MQLRQLALLFTFSAVLGCATSPAHSDGESDSANSPPTSNEAASVSYTIDVSQAAQGRVAVSVAVDQSWSNETVFQIHKNWGGVNGIPGLIDQVHATDGSGERLRISKPADNKWRVAHEPGARLVFEYQLGQTLPGGQTSPNTLSFAPHIKDELVFLLGAVSLVKPEALGNQEGDVTVDFQWKGVPKGWTMITSHGRGEQVRARGNLGTLRHSLMYAGPDVRVHRRMVRGQPVDLAISGKWTFTDKQLADVMAKVVAAERAFFDDDSQPYFVVSALPLDLQSTPFASATMSIGTGLDQSFAMFMTHDTPISARGDLGLKHLLAHELFHNWNGSELVRTPAENAPKIYWFTEGVTEYFAREILYESELITEEQYLRHLNDQLQAYQTNPMRTVSNAELTRKFWTSRHGRELAYQRGAMLAQKLDRKIQVASGGKKSLADLMRHLHVTDQPANQPTNQYIFETIARFGGADYAKKTRSHIIDGEPIRLVGADLGPCYTIVTETRKRPIVGMNIEQSLASKTVQGVKANSPAAKAGLKNGQNLLGFEKTKHNGQTQLHLKIDGDDRLRTVVVHPEFEEQSVRAFERRHTCERTEAD
jgi:predicted metalloprotease with PDZ domain